MLAPLWLQSCICQPIFHNFWLKKQLFLQLDGNIFQQSMRSQNNNFIHFYFILDSSKSENIQKYLLCWLLEQFYYADLHCFCFKRACFNKNKNISTAEKIKSNNIFHLLSCPSTQNKKLCFLLLKPLWPQTRNKIGIKL
jgi:hypothetical protein